MSQFWKCAPVFFMIAFQCFIVLHYYDVDLFKLTTQQKYVGFLLNDGRLGNQLFHMITGYGIARTLNRTHYLPFNGWIEHVRKYLIRLEKVFPRLKQTYIFATNETKERVVPFAGSCCSYYDPLRLKNHTDQFLLLNFRFGHNPRYFEDYIGDIREILNFSEELRENASDLLLSLKK
ncbi:unnamed protein product [Cylicocyclus nassatus]|uniref:Uncharacterized protein n=1 Tax=Cylicocyclus nassatus TaxID=53992 RepID=A0AA36HDF2_CYLNA|nr:unnamed protein product [Cylicocyclus nassatus]